MSRTKKEGKRGWRKIKAPFEHERIDWAISARHSYGSTEKILRRNRKIWTRLANKIRRRLGKEIIEKEIEIPQEFWDELEEAQKKQDDDMNAAAKEEADNWLWADDD